MSRNIDSLIAVTKAVVDAVPWEEDPKCCPVPWRNDVFEDAQSRPLVIAVMQDDGVVRPHPPIARVLNDVTKRLEMAGHEIVAWTPGDLHQKCIDIMVSGVRPNSTALAKHPTGPILYRGRRRRYSKRCRGWGRAFHTSRRSARQQRKGHLSI
jgi:Asp-tRNA(Asn)/Glu-tRNA(Gln) amidotransferase A subunit family amidase